MATTPSILSTIAGKINQEEIKTSVEVNCNPVDPGIETSTTFNSTYRYVTIPYNSDAVIPLSGGAIVQINTNNPEYNFLKKDNTTYYAKVAAAKTIITDILKNKWASKKDDVQFSNYELIADLKLNVNKTFYELAKYFNSTQNFYEKDNVPEFILSTLYYTGSAGSLELKYQNAKERDSNLNPFSSLQFIPFELILEIYACLSTVKTQKINNVDVTTGVGTFVGDTLQTFSSIYTILKDLSDNPKNYDAAKTRNIISLALLEIMPLYRVAEEVVLAESDDKLQLAGFYTFFGSNFYIKTPDLSGRDSSEFYSNFISAQDDSGNKNYLYYTLEILLKNESNYEHRAIVLPYNQIPSMSLINGTMSYPDAAGNQKFDKITFNGIDTLSYGEGALGSNNKIQNNISLRYYLSPLIKSSAPIIKTTKPGDKSLSGITINTNQSIELETIPVDYRFSFFANRDPVKDTDIFIKYGTIPLHKNMSLFGATSLDVFLSSINRPEVIIVDRENSKNIDEKETLFYSTEQQTTRYIMSGNAPRFLYSRNRTSDEENLAPTSEINWSENILPSQLNNSTVPHHWIELEPDASSGGELSLKLTDAGKTRLLSLFKPDSNFTKDEENEYFDISSSENNISFSLYIIDATTGQFARVPSPNINIVLDEAIITDIKPSGYYGGPAVKTDDKICIEIIGSGLSNAESAHLVLATGDLLIASKSDLGFIATQNSVSICIDKKWSELTSSIGEFSIFLKVSKSKNKETNKDIKINISSNDAETNTLKLKGTEKINLLSLRSIYYPSKGPASGLSTINTNGPDSIPLLFSGTDVSIPLGASTSIFNANNYSNLFAYLAIKDSGNISGRNIVESFGLKEDVISVKVNEVDYYTNKSMLWIFGEENFEKSYTDGRASLKIPGPGKNGALNLRALVDNTDQLTNAYIIFSNELLTSSSTIIADSQTGFYSASVLQLGESSEKPAFINAPHILGMIAKTDQEKDGISNFDVSSIANASKSSSGSIGYKIRKAIPSKMFFGDAFKKIRNGEISVSDKIKYLFVLFNAPSRSKKYYEDNYRFFIGQKDITDLKVKKIKYIEKNIACVCFKNISSSGIEGYSDFKIVVDDSEFNSKYDSNLYTKVSKRIVNTADVKEFEITTNNDVKTIKLLSNSSRKLATYNLNGSLYRQDNSKLVVPIIDNSETYLYQKFGYLTNNSAQEPWAKSQAILSVNTGAGSTEKLYSRYASPIKIKPIDLPITFGNLESVGEKTIAGQIYGSVLSDYKKDNNGKVKEDVITVSFNSLKTIVSKEESLAAAESIQKESSAKSGNISSRNDAVLSDPNSSDEDKETARQSQQSLLDFGDASKSLDDLIKDANSTVDQINEAIAKVNSLMQQAAALADKLSSANFSLSSAVDSMLDANSGGLNRPTDISSLNQFYSYLPETFEYNVDYVLQSNSNENEIFITVLTKIEQNHTIKAKVAEIYSISINNLEYKKEDFGNIKISGDKTVLIVRVIGGDKDLKFELNGYRSSSELLKIEGEFYIYKVELTPAILTLSFSGSSCAKLTITNSNKDRLKVERVIDPTAGQDVEKFFDKKKNEITKPAKKKLDDAIKKAKMKLGPQTYDTALTAKEFLKSICDMSFHLTAEISFQLKSLKMLFIPIKVIFCIIDVICALLNPVKLAFAIIRLFTCLFDLILLLPQISMPLLFLTLALHILELILCVIQKIIGLTIAINETISALDTAVREKDFESIKNLELTLNEHFLTLEADLQVMEPIMQIIGLILELLQLAFAFPCQINQDADEPACIDPSMLAGLIVGKVAPKGTIVPDAMIPLAQAYTNLTLTRVGENGNTPDYNSDNGQLVDDIDLNKPPLDDNGTAITNVLYTPSDAIKLGTTSIVGSNSGYSGNPLPDLIDSETNEAKTVGANGFFSGDQNSDGFIDNINYSKMRFSNSEFAASFGISCTKSKKRFTFGLGIGEKSKNDPRFVEFQFKSQGLTKDGAWGNLAWFYSKKIIDDSFPLDSSPYLLKKDGSSLKIHAENSTLFDTTSLNFISPIDGFSNFIEFVSAQGDSDGPTYTYKAKPLVANIDILETNQDPVTGEPIVSQRTVTKTFGGIPSFAIVDDKFNVYFVEENGLSFRIEEYTDNTGNLVKTPVIDSIFAKMINFPSATTQKLDKEERQTIRSTNAYTQKGGWIEMEKSDIVNSLLEYCGGSGIIQNRTSGYGNDLGDAILKLQANAGYLETLNSSILKKINSINSSWVAVSDDKSWFGSSDPMLLVGDPTADPAVPYTSYINYRKLNDVWFSPDGTVIGGSDNYVGVNGAQNLTDYLVAADPTLSGQISFPFPEYGIYDFVNGSWSENDDFKYAISTIDVYNFPQIYFVDLRQVASDISAACGASQTNELLLDMPGFNFDFGADVVEPYQGCLRDFLDFFVGDNNGLVTNGRRSLAEGRIPDQVSIPSIKKMYENLIACTNKAIDDSCKFVINPLNTTFKLIEDYDETDLSEYVDPSMIITEVITDGAVSTMPTITGAMEYASGIGDMATVKTGKYATIQIIPRDSYDDEIIDSFDMSSRISVTITSDSTSSGARLEKIDPTQDSLWKKNGSVYSARITSDTPGKVTLKASVCNVVIQAVTDRGITIETVAPSTGPDCIPDVTAGTTSTADLFPPGALVKVDRILTVLFTANQFVDNVSDSASGFGVSLPQVPFTDMVN